MDEAKKAARRKLLAEIKGPWDSDRLDAAMSAPPQPPSVEMRAAVEAAAARLDDSDAPPISVPTMDELDAAWEDEDDDAGEEEGRQAFDSEQEVDSESELPEEPELPDERLDPVGYAVEKQAREERAAARRERQRIKAEAKKARRKARAEAAKGKQKTKSRKTRAQQPPAAAASSAKAIEEAAPEVLAKEDDLEARLISSPPSVKERSAKRALAANAWMLALALVVVVAGAIAASVMFR